MMNIKIEAGANVQITDKPIINVYGDMVQHKEVHIHPEEKKQDAEKTEVKSEEQPVDVVEQLKPIFFNNEDDVRTFLKEISTMKPNDITDLVNRWVQDKRISDFGYSRKGDLWEILNKAGLYTKSRQNWNRRVN